MTTKNVFSGKTDGKTPGIKKDSPFPVVDRVHPDFHELLREQTGKLIEKRRSMSAIEEKWLRMDGTPVELVISATPIIYKKQDSALISVRKKV